MGSLAETPSASSAAQSDADGSSATSAVVDTAAEAIAAAGNAQSDDEICEQQLLEAVMRESLSEEDSQQSPAALSDPTSCASPESSLSKSELLASMSGPSMRFVMDVTFPDSSAVLPGSVLNKVWRITNDGVVAWPAGVCLVASGGDNLSEPGHTFIVPSPVNPGEDIEAGVVLTAPRHAGRYVSYFRLATPQGINFGQRLWADINVVEEEDNGWDVVGNSISSAGVSLSPADEEAILTVPVASADVSDAPAEVLVEDVEVGDEDDNAAAVPSTHLVAHESKYGRELFALREMGFSDLNVVIPLLTRHIPEPETMSDATRVDCLQHVIISLLSQSGAFNF